MHDSIRIPRDSNTLFHITEEPEVHPLTAMAASNDPDTLYLHQAMKEPDADEFRKAMCKEFGDQWDNGNFKLIRRKDLPKGARVLPGVWAFKRKRRVQTGEVYKHKARWNLDGSKQTQEDYTYTYSPNASWPAIRLQLVLTLLHGWHSKQIDYVQAFPQAPIEKIQCAAIPKGINIEGIEDPSQCCLEVVKNVYGGKSAGRQWYLHLKGKLESKGFVRSQFDECVFYRGNCLCVLCTDDSILTGPDQAEVDRAIADIKATGLKVTVEGNVKDFLGVNIERHKNGSITFSQPHLIDKVLKAMHMSADNLKPKPTPMASSRILSRHSNSEDFDKSFNYRSVVGMLNYIDKGSRSDIACAAHQCARFVENPKVEHGKALRWLARYLKGTRDKGMTYKPDITKGIEVFVDSDFAGNWDKDEAAHDRDTARSRHGYIIKYAGCPITWKSQLQTEIALSSTEAEYTGLSYALREAIPVIELIKEMKKHGFPVAPPDTTIKCKVFEDNSGALEMARIHKYRPRTKHLNVKLHHFRNYVERKIIDILPIQSDEQLADYLTKPVNERTLANLRKQVMGW